MKNLFRTSFVLIALIVASFVSVQASATTGHYTAGVEVSTQQLTFTQDRPTVAGAGFTDFSPYPATDVCTTTTIWPDSTIIPPVPVPLAGAVVVRTHGYYTVNPVPTFTMRGVLHRMKQVCQ